MAAYSYYEYYSYNGADFFTLVLMPDKLGKFPVVITRSPYVNGAQEKPEEELCELFFKNNIEWTDNNYVLIFQHCRGQGKSTGDFVPYIHEREDGLALRKWIREQSFYNGQLFLLGSSYTASLHYCTTPFEDDIKGAVFNVQDSERYRLWYRNGNMRRGHANWHFDLYKAKSNLHKTHTMDSFSSLPLQNLSEKVLGERADDFEEMLSAPCIDHDFWQTRNGGFEAKDALKSANIPILLTTGYNDYYVGGMFKMWDEMDDETRKKSAFLVSPYNHGDSYDKENGICFNNASLEETFGNDYAIKWFNAILYSEIPFVHTGKITYYRTFEDRWQTDFYAGKVGDIRLSLSDGVKTIIYNPENPSSFPPEGAFMDNPHTRDDIITIYTAPMERDVFVKGRMKAKLSVSSNCEDTTFYMMVALETPKGDYALRHDIASINFQKETYQKNDIVFLDFEFDEYAFLIKKGQRLRIDISSTDKNTYVCHTNIKGDYSLIGNSKKAENKVFLLDSFLILPIESENI